MTALAAQVRTELVLTARRGESVLLLLVIPLGLLVFFSNVDVLPLPPGVDEPIEFLAPGILALAVLSTAMVQTAIGTAFERQYGVLKRLAVTPLGRPRLLGAKIAGVLAVELAQLLVIGAAAVALGWDPAAGSAATVVAAVVAGTAAFAGLGLLMAGRLRGEVVLAAANGLYLVLLLLGGMVIPLEELPAAVETLARALPSAALSEILRAATAGDGAAGAWGVLLAWAVAAPVAAARTFRWE